jgi:hypothetical protein
MVLTELTCVAPPRKVAVFAGALFEHPRTLTAIKHLTNPKAGFTCTHHILAGK